MRINLKIPEQICLLVVSPCSVVSPCLLVMSSFGNILNLDWTVHWTLDPGLRTSPSPKENYPKKTTPKSPSLPPFTILYKKERETRITFYGNKDKSKKHFTPTTTK